MEFFPHSIWLLKFIVQAHHIETRCEPGAAKDNIGRVNGWVCVCVCVCVCVYAHACLCAWTHMHACMCVRERGGGRGAERETTVHLTSLISSWWLCFCMFKLSIKFCSGHCPFCMIQCGTCILFATVLQKTKEGKRNGKKLQLGGVKNPQNHIPRCFWGPLISLVLLAGVWQKGVVAKDFSTLWAALWAKKKQWVSFKL